jgi:Uma2 family endonuclease
MTFMPVMPREASEWTVDDLDLLPDDGLRYELLDGTLLVSPVPTRRHQRALFDSHPC